MSLKNVPTIDKTLTKQSDENSDGVVKNTNKYPTGTYDGAPRNGS